MSTSERIRRRVALLIMVLSTFAASLSATPPGDQVDAFDRPVIDAEGQRLVYTWSETEGLEPVTAESTPESKRVPQTLTRAERSATRGTLTKSAGALGVEREWYRTIWGYGIGAVGMGLGDLDGDGSSELVASARAGDHYWYVAAPDAGAFEKVWASGPYERINVLRVRDLDGDGEDEVLVGAPGEIEIFGGLPAQRLRTIATSGDAYGLRVGDVDLDGALEIVFADGAGLHVLDAASGSPEYQETLGFAVRDLDLGNVDDDAALEIVIAGQGAWYADKPARVVDGVSHVGETLQGLDFGAFVRVGDLDGDGRDEIVAAETWYEIDIIAWDPVGGYALSDSISSELDIDALQLADWDGDGALEIVYGDGQWGSIYFHDGSTGALEHEVDNPEHGVTDLVVGDADGNGTTDLVWGAGFSSSGADYLFVHDLPGSVTVWQSVDISGPFRAMAAADLDLDGTPELVSGSFESESGYGDGLWFIHDAASKDLEFTSPEPTGTNWMGLTRVRVAQADADPQPEVFVVSSSTYTPKVVVYDGLDRTQQLVISGESGLHFLGMEAVDVDGDGTLEVVTATGREHTGASGVYVEVYDATTGVLEWRSPSLASGFADFHYLRVAEIDGDGRLEIVVGANGGAVRAFDGVSGAAEWAVTPGAAALDTADHDGDGVDEVFIVTTGGAVRVLSGADGSVLDTVVSTGLEVGSLAVRDLDFDGVLDLVLAAEGRLRVVSGADGGELFASEFLGDEAGRLDGLLVEDVDGDDHVELWVDLGQRGSLMYQVGVTPPPSGLDGLARWPFDEGAGLVALDASGNGHDGTLDTGAGWTTGVELGALALDGLGGHVRVGAAPELDSLAAFSVSAWVRHERVSAWRSIVDKRDAAADGFDLYLERSGRGFVRVNGSTLTGTAAIDDGTWHHLAAVYDGASIAIYVDGALDASGAAPAGAAETSGDVFIGRNFSSGSFFGGALDDVRLFDRALTAQEIVAVHDEVPPQRGDGAPSGLVPAGSGSATLSLGTDEDAECRWSSVAGTEYGSMTEVFATTGGTGHSTTVGPLGDGESYVFYVRCADGAGHANGDDFAIAFEVAEPGDLDLGLLGHWPFDEGAGTLAADVSGLGHDGTIVGALWISDAGGPALDFDGAGDAVAVGAESDFATPAALTLSAWVRVPAGTTGWRSIVDVRDGNIDGYDLFLDDASRLFIRVNSHKLSATTVLADGVWHHVAGVWDGSELRLYVDGALEASLGATATAVDVSGALRIGDHFTASGAYGFLGAIDEVRVYDRALGDSEIASLAAP